MVFQPVLSIVMVLCWWRSIYPGIQVSSLLTVLRQIVGSFWEDVGFSGRERGCERSEQNVAKWVFCGRFMRLAPHTSSRLMYCINKIRIIYLTNIKQKSIINGSDYWIEIKIAGKFTK